MDFKSPKKAGAMECYCGNMLKLVSHLPLKFNWLLIADCRLLGSGQQYQPQLCLDPSWSSQFCKNVIECAVVSGSKAWWMDFI